MINPIMLLVSLFFFTTFAIPAATTPVTYNISLDTASLLTLDGVASRLLRLLSLFVHSFFGFLQHNFLMPPWIFFILVVALILRSAPPPILEALGAAFAAPVEALAHIVRRHLGTQLEANATVAALQKRVADFEEGVVLPEKLKRSMIKRETFDLTLASYDDIISGLRETVGKLEGQVKTFEDANIALLRDLDAALYNNSLLENLVDLKRQRAKEESHKLEMARKEQVIIDCITQITELESKLTLWKAQNSHEVHNELVYLQAQREYQAALDAKDMEIHLRDAEISSLTVEVQNKSTAVYQLEQQVVMFNNLKELLLSLVEVGNQRQQIAVIICVAHFLRCGIDVTELGIDPLQLQTYFDWATMAIDGYPSALAPTEGLRLKGVRYPLSRSFVRDGETFTANKSFFAQPLPSSQSHWSPQQHTKPVISNSARFPNNSNGASSESVLQPSTSFASSSNSAHPSAPAQPEAPKKVFAEPTLVLKGSDSSSTTLGQPSSKDLNNSTHRPTEPDVPKPTSSSPPTSTNPPAQPEELATTSTPLFVFTPSPNTDPSLPIGVPISDAKPTASAAASGAFQVGEKPGTSSTAASTPSGSRASHTETGLSSGSNAGSDGDGASGSSSKSSRGSWPRKTNAKPVKLGDPMAGINAKLGGGGSRKKR
ncbi:hypothetical protein EKO04_001051 [Ascochyta lentis]|uniref:Uncharacterized protein n=1 Tax=Ascochyta lentis TaxID=205686 RepID=A0A8H7JEF0_9PLEO|nr:hypothetical protein EKO04_001051 [Ascochyta lentis]